MSDAPNKIIRKRKRENETKKWTNQETRMVLTYMQMHRNIEKPTARIYYEKLIEHTNIDATWNTLKCKIRHLRVILQKANDLLISAATGKDGDDCDTIKDKMLQICPYYDQLSDIFPLATASEFPLMATPKLEVLNYSPVDGSDSNNFKMSACEDKTFLFYDEPTTSSETNTFAGKVKCTAHNCCVNNPAETEAEWIKFRIEKLQFEKQKFEWSKEFEEKKLELEYKKQRDEFELRKLELEQNERLKMFEIEIKYKQENKNAVI
ncbi:uncharacterized protein LOC118737279 [Rhagoletis pomonella]|uniref:uncharacterized protein LOC118737279 n=1 Tax=Rhagoletis pomonella TaxID=28610 RepID=UPI0017810908|nr:uncharacterized protein LOC118737279 [Rhagoletis pomonella]XP_036323580.1 uncharacterized protein LOC118737279 [Rhagoletis pomonella]